MRSRVRKAALMVLAGVLVLGLVGLVWATETASSETGQDAMQNGSPVSTPAMPSDVLSAAGDSEWSLVLDGLVESPLTLTLDDLVAMPTSTVYADLYCVGLPTQPLAQGDWIGVRLGYMLEQAGVLPAAVKVAFTAAHDGFTTDLTVTTAMRDDIILAYERDGEPLAQKQLVVPCMWGYKWIREPTHIELVDYDFLGTYESVGYPDEAYRVPDDFDCDQVNNEDDNCESIPNPDQANADGDAWGDACDNCPTTATLWVVPVGDDDCDGFTTADEGVIGTDPAAACPDALDDDAWPPDLNAGTGCEVGHDGSVNILDVLCYKGKLAPDPYDARYDINQNPPAAVNILDVLLYKWFINMSCTNP
jgi:DMSO/TMAO reductase YedYZ molybdopterin-dependent catalytic subunit